jgi:hypothetical protein
LAVAVGEQAQEADKEAPVSAEGRAVVEQLLAVLFWAEDLASDLV